MSAPLFLVTEQVLTSASPGGTLTLEGPEGHHAADVQRLGVGEQVQIADGAGRYAVGRVSAARRGELEVAVDEVVQLPPPDPRLVLVQALAKAERDLLAVEMATELGVDAVVPWQAERSIVRWKGERAARAHRKWLQALRAATKQARRPILPELAPVADLESLTERVRQAPLTLVLHEDAEQPLAGVELPSSGEVLIVVGPEGGVSEHELTRLRGAGAVPVRLGPCVLRTSTAGPSALAALSARTRWR